MMLTRQSLSATRTVSRMCPSPLRLHSRLGTLTPRRRTRLLSPSSIFVPSTFNGIRVPAVSPRAPTPLDSSPHNNAPNIPLACQYFLPRFIVYLLRFPLEMPPHCSFHHHR